MKETDEGKFDSRDLCMELFKDPVNRETRTTSLKSKRKRETSQTE